MDSPCLAAVLFFFVGCGPEFFVTCCIDDLFLFPLPCSLSTGRVVAMIGDISEGDEGDGGGNGEAAAAGAEEGDPNSMRTIDLMMEAMESDRTGNSGASVVCM